MIDLKKAAQQSGQMPKSLPFQPKTKEELAEQKIGRTEEHQKSREVLEAAKSYQEGVRSILDLIAPAAFRVKPRNVDVGGRYVSTMFVVTYPRYISVGWFAPIVTLSMSLDVAMYFYPVKSNVILKQLKKKVGALEAELIGDAEKGAPRDPVKETALKDIEGLRDSLTQGTEKFFQFALYISAYADSEKELEDVMEKLDSEFGSKLVIAKRVFYQAEQGFNSTMPLANDEIQIYFNMNSSPCASSFPFISAELTSDNGILYGINRHNNSLILFDRFQLQNANSVVFASSGAGKSYTIKLEILRSLMMGTDVIVIDPENEYKFLSDSVGGTFINVSLNSEAKINPFDLPKPVGGADRPADIIRSAVITLKGLLRIMFGNITPAEDSIIDRALIETYAKKDITADSDLSTITPPIMKDFQEILDGFDGSADLVERIKKYTEGSFAGLFESPTNIDMKNQLV
ncbi:MAG: DUF87 domain-containing protein, partial [bacterium]|nr:DUF87 domain-containing protein [bacterium]